MMKTTQNFHLFSLRKIKILLILAVIIFAVVSFASAGQEKQIDPAAWGSNHVGKPMPDYVKGDECLFCHRNDIGPTWQKNAHGITIRQREDAPELTSLLNSQAALKTLAAEVEYFMGSRHRVRFLKKAGYGRFAILSVQAALNEGKIEKLIDADKPAWDKDKFAARCAGCHTTAVDAKTKEFSAFGLDCYTCHGNVDLEHTNDTSLILLSKKKKDDSRTITSICAQCHLRGSASRTLGLPYPNSFVAGDNLFQDLQVDWSKADDENLNAGDRHIFRNVRDVVLYGKTTTCLNCHAVHANSSLKHRRLLRDASCVDCHQAEGPLKNLKPYTVHSPLCEY
ncbi:MAG TPA: multiheme c-type cytochrome [Blastocatellia bacterium]